MTDFKNKTWILSDFIKFVQAKKDRSTNYNPDYNYDIYTPDDNSRLSEETIIYVGETVQVDDNDNETFPDIVNQMNYWFEYSCSNFQDVIDLATEQNPSVSVSKIVECLNYYSENDDFLDL